MSTKKNFVLIVCSVGMPVRVVDPLSEAPHFLKRAYSIGVPRRGVTIHKTTTFVTIQLQVRRTGRNQMRMPGVLLASASHLYRYLLST